MAAPTEAPERPAPASAGPSPPSGAAGLVTRQFGIAGTSLLLMACFFASAVLGVVRQVLFNAQFGAGPEASAYYAAFRLPDTLFNLIAGGALSGAMIPVLLGTVRADGAAAAARLTNLILTALLAVVAGLVLVGELFTPAFVTTLLAPGFPPATSDLTVSLTRLMLLQPVILAAGSVATAVLNSRNQFLLTALSVASHNLTLLLGLAAARADPALGIYGPTLGVVAGAGLQVVILLPGLQAGGVRFRPAWDPTNPRLREVIRLLIPNGLAVGVGYAGLIVETAFASTARESEALPALHNAWLLVGLPITLLGQAVGQSAFPRLAAQATAGAWAALRGTVLRALAVTVGLAVPAALALIGLGRLLIHLLFEHGRFDAGAGALTYTVLAAYAVALPAYVGLELVVRGLIALRDTRTPLLTNSANLAGRIAILGLFLGSLGVVAIPLAFAGMAILETLVVGVILLRRIGRHLAAEAATAAPPPMGRRPEPTAGS